ncbi:AtpZ/AtpI family protein [Pseudoxanthobacter sp.]|uniref:AtpZ/AtpI family protein n=1 Tax=Pseudoxanthobacter sp. TaxID=1925742 RepID=UPI002FE075C2
MSDPHDGSSRGPAAGKAAEGAGADAPPDDAALEARRRKINAAIGDQARSRRAAVPVSPVAPVSATAGWSQAMKLSSEFIGGIAVGGAIGWGLDWLLGTLPFGLIVFLLLGFAAGIMNVLRAVGHVPQPEQRLDRPSQGGQDERK